MNINKDDLFYVCTMIEYVSRRTHNKCKDIVAKISDDELEHQLKVAEINHCLPFEQVSDEWIEQFGINNGTFDNITSCRYKVPSVTSIGRVYQRLIIFVNKDNEDVIKTISWLKEIFCLLEQAQALGNLIFTGILMGWFTMLVS